MSRGFVEWPEPSEIALYTAERVGRGNDGVVEAGSEAGGLDVGVCERRIEVEDILLDDNG